MRNAALLVVLGVLAWPAAAHAEPLGDGLPPELPVPANGCVGASPVLSSRTAWALQRMAPEQVWPATRGEGVVVAVLDTGVATVPALDGAVLTRADVVSGDCRGRGTALAGLIAARPATGSGVVGLAPAARIFPVRITDRQHKVTAASIATGIRAATAANVDVILIGIGITGGSADLRQAVAAAAARDILVVAPIDDSAPQPPATTGPVRFPAAYPDVLAVGGLSDAGTVAGAPGRDAGVDLAGPSVGAVSLAPVGPGHYRVAGAPVAAAYVAGAAALVRSYHPELSAEQVRQRLERSAERPANPALTEATGAGMVDPYAAVTGTRPRETAASPVVPSPARLPVARATAPSRAIGLAVTAAVFAAAALAFAAVVTVRLGRRRRWRP
jgi:membrane-anchored mycosin MYCP